MLSRHTNISPLPQIAPATIEAKPEHLIHRVEHARRTRKSSAEREACDAKMTEMWNRGEPVDVIADVLTTTPGMVYGMRHRLGLPCRKPQGKWWWGRKRLSE